MKQTDSQHERQGTVGGVQRCMAVIRGEKPDRVPGSILAIACDVSSKLLGREVATGSPSLWYAEAKSWMRGDAAHAEFEARLPEDLIDLYRLLGLDVYVGAWRHATRPSRQIDDYTFVYGDPDGEHSIWRWDPVVMNFIQRETTAPRPAPEDWPELARKMATEIDDLVAEAREHAGRVEQGLQERLGDEMLVLAGGGGLSLGVDEASLMACLLEPAAVGDMLDCRLEVALAAVEAIAARGLKVINGGGDMADKNGPIYSPDVFRRLMLPRLKKLASRCKELGLHYIWRTDGKLWPVTDMLFQDAGFPAYGEVDRDASMTVAAIRERYPDLIVWNNASADTLRRRSRAEAYDHAVQILEESDGRRYIHGCSNAILPGTPPENVVALFDARNRRP